MKTGGTEQEVRAWQKIRLEREQVPCDFFGVI